MMAAIIMVLIMLFSKLHITETGGTHDKQQTV